MSVALQVNFQQALPVHAGQVDMESKTDADDAREGFRVCTVRRAVSMDTSFSNNYRHRSMSCTLSGKLSDECQRGPRMSNESNIQHPVSTRDCGEEGNKSGVVALNVSCLSVSVQSSKNDEKNNTCTSDNCTSENNIIQQQNVVVAMEMKDVSVTCISKLKARKENSQDKESFSFSHIHGNIKQNEHRPKQNLKKRKREQGKNKKWRKISTDTVCGFDLSLFPWRSPNCDVTDDMENALREFADICASEDCPVQQDQTPKHRTTTVEVEEEKFFDQHMGNDISLKLTQHQNKMVETLTGLTSMFTKRLRRKKKWRIQKAHKQIKTKHCLQVNNCQHGVNLHINFRIVKLMSMTLESQSRYLDRMDLKKFDKSLTVAKAERNPSVQTPNTPRPGRPMPRRPAAPVPAYALSSNNADQELGADLVNILINLQNRDLTPEDYDLLLRLDERVKVKTVDKQTIAALKTDSITTENLGEKCAICMDDYALGDMRKYLPCGHYFHSECVDQWLANSTTCPLDGTEVQS